MTATLWSLNIAQNVRQRIVGSPPALRNMRRQQAIFARAVVIPSEVVDDGIETDAFHRNTHGHRGSHVRMDIADPAGALICFDGQTEAVCIGRIAFRYGRWAVSATDTAAIVLHMDGLTPIELHPYPKAEKAAMCTSRLYAFSAVTRVRHAQSSEISTPQTGYKITEARQNFEEVFERANRDEEIVMMHGNEFYCVLRQTASDAFRVSLKMSSDP